MSSSLFQQPRNPNKLNLLQMAKGIINNDPDAIYNEMYRSNPEFKKFIDENQGMSMEDIALKYNIPLK